MTKQEIQPEPTPWRDMVVASLVREGINKHRARELADHFAAQPEPPPEWEGINNIIAEYGLQAIDFVADWKAALGQAEPMVDCPRCGHVCSQRPWVDMTDEEMDTAVNSNITITDSRLRDGVYGVALDIAALLKEKNT
jgi:hypothetical protein